MVRKMVENILVHTQKYGKLNISPISVEKNLGENSGLPDGIFSNPKSQFG
jgi:hypothetical protein